ncbi:MAG TPA: hypothetical protein VIP11_18720 [Gemmatimonadaceae bacterium]
MALSLWRWLVATALGCVAIWFGLSTKGPKRPAAAAASNDELAFKAHAYYSSLATIRQATDRLRLVTIRDSVLAIANRRPAPGLTVLVSDEFASAGLQLDSLLKNRYAQNVGSTNTRLIVAAVMDSAQIERGLPRSRSAWTLPISVFLPQPGDSTCVAILRVGLPFSSAPAYVTRNLLSPETVGSILSPCSYYATFGAPGPDIARWLRERSWRFGQIADWKQRPEPLSRRSNNELPLYARVGGFDDNFWRVRSMVSTAGLTCLAGRPGKCAEVALTSVPTGDSAWRSNVVALSGTNQMRFYFPREPMSLGPSDGWILSEMVRMLGPDKFAQFWRSTEPVERAFASASGRSLDDWIGDWARGVYGPVQTGPQLPIAGVVTGFVFLIAGFGLSSAIANRRRVA